KRDSNSSRSPMIYRRSQDIYKLTATLMVVCFGGVLATCYAPMQQGTKEQREFSMEGELKSPVGVPMDVLALLRKDSDVLECLEQSQSPDDVRGDWFVGAKIHLGSSEYPDLVVQPQTQPTTTNPCLLHAHSMPFWVFTSTEHRYVLALKDSAQVLRVLKTKSNGYCDIETSMTTTLGQTSWLYKFDGHQYKLLRKATTPP